MKIVFLSNYYNHHQHHISKAFFKKTDGKYSFIATTKMSRERKALGYGMETIPEYVIDYKYHPECKYDIENADCVIYGSAPFVLIKNRTKKNKYIFKYSERPLKKGDQLLKYIPRFIRWHLNNSKNTYLLCASAFASADYAKYNMYKKKAYKWGYFPETKYYDEEVLFKRKDKKKILWCGRFLDWKHPDDVIKVAVNLKSIGYDFTIDMLGIGEMEPKIRQMIKDNNLEDCVKLLGSVKADFVRQYMEQAGIFLFTSDFKEGWGAVLNESMNSGCAVVASHAIGSVPFLLKNEKNGLVYENGNVKELSDKVKYLLDNPDKQELFGIEAYHTIKDMWNAEIAAERFLKLTEEIMKKGSCDLYHDGPCSKAPIIKNNWLGR